VKDKVYLYDTTLRDGSQAEGVSYSLRDKVMIVERLDDFGIHFIEGGWPYGNLKDIELFEYFKKNKLKNSQLVAFGSTMHSSSMPGKDENLNSLLKAETEYITIFGKSWDLHVKEVLRIKLDENVRIISESIKYLAKRGRKVFYDAEHFFDGYKNNKQYALAAVRAALDAGAQLVVFCDTNGGTTTNEVDSILTDAVAELGIKEFGMHCHNDLGLAVSNSISCVGRGCTHIQGTINGIGERCGNADLVPIMGILQFKMGIALIPSKKIGDLTKLSYFVSEISNMIQKDNSPFIGRSAFAHKAGVHIDAVIKNPLAYEHIDPVLVGNKRRFLVSEQSGKSTLVDKAKELDYDLDKKSPKTIALHKALQLKEQKGYQFEAAEGSFKLLLHKTFKKYKSFFELQGFRVIIEKDDKDNLISEATIKLKVDGNFEHTAALGDGPVNALDNALRKALVKFYPVLSEMHLTDFKVRVLDAKSGTEAKVRVFIESQDKDESWVTIGVSENIIEACWQALVDSVEYKILKAKKSGRLK